MELTNECVGEERRCWVYYLRDWDICVSVKACGWRGGMSESQGELIILNIP